MEKNLLVFRAVKNTHRGSPEHPAAVWEGHKEEIRRLYIEERVSVKDLVVIMSTKGLVATEKMYKDRIRQWGFVKYNTRRGRTPHHAGRRPQAQRPPAEHTLPRPLAPPGAVHFREEFIGRLRPLIQRHYTLGHNINRGIVPFLSHILSGPRQALNDLIQASWCLDSKDDRGVQLASTAFDVILDLRHDRNFYSLLYMFISLRRWRHAGLLHTFLKCLARSTAYLLGQNHGLSVLAQQVYDRAQSEGPFQLALEVSDCMGAILASIGHEPNTDDFCIAWLKCDYAWNGELTSLFAERLHREIISLRNSLTSGVRADEIDACSRSAYAHRQVIRKRQEAHSYETEAAISGHYEADIPASPGGADVLQALCFSTMAQYHRGLVLEAQANSTPQSILESDSVHRAQVLDDAHWNVDRSPTMDEVRQLEIWDTQASCWAEVEAAKVKWVTGMWTVNTE
ncbi:hypothetical protein GQ53DRAFT_92931 [Thozetella sp. PMI_491]|nr:hypothetical protein GQ53DRAFT_92931 [Thozetella sp. PMI_491]